MRYQRTQIYLEPDDHRRLKDEAARRGISLAALLREIASAHVAREGAPAYGEKSWDAIIGICETGEPSDIGRYEDEYRREVARTKALELERESAERVRETKKGSGRGRRP